MLTFLTYEEMQMDFVQKASPVRVDLSLVFGVATVMRQAADSAGRGANRGIDMLRTLAAAGVSVVVDDPDRLFEALLRRPEGVEDASEEKVTAD